MNILYTVKKGFMLRLVRFYLKNVLFDQYAFDIQLKINIIIYYSAIFASRDFNFSAKTIKNIFRCRSNAF